MNCEHFHKNALAYEEGGNIFAELGEMTAHLSVCSSCSKRFPTLREDLALVRQLKTIAIPTHPAAFWENNVGVIRSQLASESRKTSSQRRSFFLGLSSLAASLTLIAFFIFAGKTSLFHPFSLNEEDLLEASQDENLMTVSWRDFDEEDLSSLYTRLLPVDTTNNREPEVERSTVIPTEYLEQTQVTLPENLSDDEVQVILNQLESIEI